MGAFLVSQLKKALIALKGKEQLLGESVNTWGRVSFS